MFRAQYGSENFKLWIVQYGDRIGANTDHGRLSHPPVQYDGQVAKK